MLYCIFSKTVSYRASTSQRRGEIDTTTQRTICFYLLFHQSKKVFVVGDGVQVQFNEEVQERVCFVDTLFVFRKTKAHQKEGKKERFDFHIW